MSARKRTGRRAGFTLVETLIVIAIIGSLMMIGYQLLQSLWSDQLSGNSPMQLESLFKHARDKSLATGDILSLELNLDRRRMGLKIFEPGTETSTDDVLEKMWFDRNSANLTEAERLRRGLKDGRQPEKSGAEEDDEETGKMKKADWILEPTPFPSDLEKVYSVSGLELTGPLIYIHFYPNGLSDSIILYFKGRAKPYMYVPAQNLSPVFLEKMDSLEQP